MGAHSKANEKVISTTPGVKLENISKEPSSLLKFKPKASPKGSLKPVKPTQNDIENEKGREETSDVKVVIQKIPEISTGI